MPILVDPFLWLVSLSVSQVFVGVLYEYTNAFRMLSWGFAGGRITMSDARVRSLDEPVTSQ